METVSLANRSVFMNTADPITIISKMHGWRTLGGLKTSDFYTYKAAVENGCHLQSASFSLRHPEEMLVDLSNLEPPFDLMTPNDIIKCWHLLSLAADAGNPELALRIRGDGLSPEVAISGPSHEYLKQTKMHIIKDVLSRCGSLETDHAHPRGIHKRTLLTETTSQTLQLHNNICAFYSSYVSHEHWNVDKMFNTRFVYDSHPVWDQIKRIGKHKVFLLAAGLPLALGYLNSTGDEHIYFSEVHRQNDSGLMNRRKSFEEVFPSPTIDDETWVIIDKSYTGGSIRQAANNLRRLLGYKIKIKTVALFPKSFGAFMSADYAVYAGCLFDVKQCAKVLDRSFWHLQLIENNLR